MIEPESAVPAAMLALVAWTLVMLAWLYATRLPAMAAAKLAPTPDADFERLPDWARRPAANYNHLHEQPTLFYALGAILTYLGAADPLTIALAWAYVALRVVHSLVQSLVNHIPTRFSLFVLSAICLAALTAQAGFALFG